MSRKFIGVLATVVVLDCIVVWSAMVWPNIANSSDGQTSMTRVDFDQAFASLTAMPRREGASAMLVQANFDRAFASVIALHRRENTPPNREKLRNAGWKRILGSS
jgi:hypothetical protein